MLQQDYNNLTDADLLQQYKLQQDNKWLGILLQRYTLMLFGVCMKYLKNENKAKDTVQQVFEKAILEIPKYEITYFKSWIYMIAKNNCLMQLRSNKDFKEINETIFVKDETFDIDELQNKEEDYTFLAASISELNLDQMHCIDLFYLQKKSYQEIVDNTSYTLMQVKSHIQNGKRNLKILIEKKRQNQHAK